MKKYFVCIILTNLFLCSAQEKAIDFGVKIGLNNAYVPEFLDEIKDNKSIYRLNAGIFINYALSEKFELQPELEYSLRGTNAVFIYKDDTYTGGNPIDIHADLKLNYINLPIMTHWKFRPNWYLALGPYFGYLVKDYIHMYANAEGISANEEGTLEEVAEKLSGYGTPIKGKVNNWDVGVNLEGGYHFNNGIGIMARFSQGLTKIVEGKEEKLKSSPRNQVFFFGVEYRR